MQSYLLLSDRESMTQQHQVILLSQFFVRSKEGNKSRYTNVF